VVEDTPIGVTAGVAAGATVWGYAPPCAPMEALTHAGAAHVFTHMRDLRI
jgi:beta-phosphoglucomutase-like phosphatase (HAD superfamily)